jgi:hypothetical protein
LLLITGVAASAAVLKWSDADPNETVAGQSPSSGVTGEAGTSPQAPTPSPSATAEPSTPASASSTKAPAGPGGFPNASNTGVKPGLTLKRSGSIKVTRDGTVLQNLLLVDSSIEVWANNVTIRNVRITTDKQEMDWGIAQRGNYRGLVVEDTEIFSNLKKKISYGIIIHDGGATMRRVNIHATADSIVTSAGVIEDSYLHDPAYFPNDHTDMIQTQGGPGPGLTLVIRHNTIINTEGQTGAISLFDDSRPLRNVRVEGNFLAGGGYTLYGGGYRSDGKTPANIVVVDNVFSRMVFPKGGYYGAVAYFDSGAPGNVWSDNRWEDGKPLKPS